MQINFNGIYLYKFRMIEFIIYGFTFQIALMARAGPGKRLKYLSKSLNTRAIACSPPRGIRELERKPGSWDLILYSKYLIYLKGRIKEEQR